jgi:hypothetical protein
MARHRLATGEEARAASRGRRAGGIGALAVVGMLLGAPSSGLAAVTLGSDLSRPADLRISHPSSTFSLANVILPGRTLTSPTNGVVTRWRIKTDGGAAGPFSLRVFRPNLATGTGTGVATGPPESPAAGQTLHTFPARLPIAAGDGIGINGSPSSPPTPQPGQPFGAYLADHPGALLVVWVPALGDGETRAPSGTEPDTELLVNADVEPDQDGDGFGDESQDQCRTDNVPAGGPCTAPTGRLGGRRTQRLRQRAVVVTVAGVSENSTATARGNMNVPGGSRVFRLRRAQRQVAAGGRATLRLRMPRRAIKAARRALARRKRVRASVRVTLTDAGGNARTLRRAVRIRR